MDGRHTVGSRGVGTRGTRLVGATLAVAGVLLLTACGDDVVSTPQSSVTGAPGSGTASITPSTPGGDAALEARAKAHFIPLAALGEGWRESQPPPAGFGLTVCGVDIEPEQPAGSARQRFAKSGVGPFVAQYVQAHREGLAAEVVTALKAALPTCTTFETRGESPTSPVTRFTIDKVPFADVSENAVVWRMTSQGERPVTQDVALLADGEFLIGVVSYRAGDAPDPATITTAVAAVPTEG